MTASFDRVDRKILMTLGVNARLSQQQIGKICGTSRDVVQYRMSKLERAKVIKGYVAHTQNWLFGIKNYLFCVKLQNYTPAKEKHIINKLKAIEHVKLLYKCRGDYDLLALVGATNTIHLASLQQRMSNICDKQLRNMDLTIFVKPLKLDHYQYLLSNFAVPHPKRIKTKEVDVDAKDRKIIKYLSGNARMSILELAKKVRLSAEQTSKRLRSLTSQGIITNTQAVVDLAKLGYERYIVFLKLSTYHYRLESSLKELFRQSSTLSYAERSLGLWDLRLSILSTSHGEFLAELDRIRDYLGSRLQNYSVTLVVDEVKRTVYVGSKRNPAARRATSRSRKNKS